jgi:hypothetical protein
MPLPSSPARRAYTVGYELSDGEAALYKSVTDYVRIPETYVWRLGPGAETAGTGPAIPVG